MASRIAQLTIDVHDVEVMARFWSQALGYRVDRGDDGSAKLFPPDDAGPEVPTVWLQATTEPKEGKNRNHPDLRPADGDVDAEVERLMGLGARPIDVGQSSDDPFVVLADPEGNEFCVLRREPRTPAGRLPAGGDRCHSEGMAALNDAARRLIESGPLAHMVTLNEDGSPQVSVVWVGLDGDELVSGHLPTHQRKLANIRRDPRIALSFEGSTDNPIGMRHYLVVHGRARITEGGAPELLHRLAQTYVGPGTPFPPMPDPPPGYLIHVTVTRVGGQGPWVDASG